MRLQVKASRVAARCSSCCGTNCCVSAFRAGSVKEPTLNSTAISTYISLQVFKLGC